MILKASQRAGGGQLAAHLMNVEDNEHMELYELRGFVSSDLKSAFNEIYAISKGTRCKQFMFSLSLNPPETENVPVKDFEKAIEAIEKKLGLEKQPRAIVFHEKEGRRHAHCVWSRIDVERMKAINLPYFKLKLRDISRDLYMEHDWKMPPGLVNSQERDPANFTLAEWQQAKRAGQDAKELKQAFQDCWAISDSRAGFANALAERGLHLAKGDRRGFVAVDHTGEIYAIARWVGVKTKEVKAKLGDPDNLLSVADTKAHIAEKMTGMLERHIDEKLTEYSAAADAMDRKRTVLVERQRQERKTLIDKLKRRHIDETKQRAAKLPRGLRAIWFRLTGKYSKIKKQNEIEAEASRKRNRTQKQALLDRQLGERRLLQRQLNQVRHQYRRNVSELHKDIKTYLEMSSHKLEQVLTTRMKERQQRSPSIVPRLRM